jgi:hypothetical protein
MKGLRQLLLLHRGLGSDDEDASEEERIERVLFAWPGMYVCVCVCVCVCMYT